MVRRLRNLMLVLLLGSAGCLVSFDFPVSDGTQDTADEDECCEPGPGPETAGDGNADADDPDESEDPETDS
ncbi:MAG: hypothetical protein ABIJ56_22620 [Pseudomonadota bacterium]